MSPTPFVYLAHPIDFADQGYADNAAYAFNQENLAAYIPSYAFKLPYGAPPNEVLNRINRAALSECDALVAVLPRDRDRSAGVFMEIEQARSEGKPTLIVDQHGLWTQSWALPHTDLVVFAEELDGVSLRALKTVMLRVRRARRKPPSSQALYVQLDGGAALPTRVYAGDAGFDMYTVEETLIPAGEFVDVPVGLRVQFPDTIWGLIIGRSSTVRKLDLLVTPGVIDTGYRGPLFAGVRSMRTDDYLVKKGERLAQLIPFTNVAATLHATAVDVLAPSDRGEAGFGSSGA